ncbi:MAG: hypothetical protein HKN63_06530 [Rhodobacteraceae bacterium]|nr:hypothetical protein [Paracoccaceae bacterium]
MGNGITPFRYSCTDDIPFGLGVAATTKVASSAISIFHLGSIRKYILFYGSKAIINLGSDGAKKVAQQGRVAGQSDGDLS